MASRRGWLSLAVLTAGLLPVGPIGALAQTSPVVCLPDFSWVSHVLLAGLFHSKVFDAQMDNSKNQNPCVMAAYLQGACNGGRTFFLFLCQYLFLIV